MRIAFIVNNDNKEIVINRPLDDLLSFVNSRGHTVEIFSNKQDLSDKDFDLFVIFGGDGTMLGQARKLSDTGAPLVGINCGHLGFTVEFDNKTFKKYWNNIETGDYVLNERILLDVKVFPEYNWKYKFHSLAANDVVVTAGPPYRLIDLNIAAVSDKDKYDDVTNIKSDGLIVSTPLGSTAYNLSVGGPIIHPDSKAICLAPIAAHSLSCRPIIVPNDFKIEIRLDQINEGTTLMIDGQKQFKPLFENELVVVTKSEYTLKTIANPYQSYWQTLKDKMHWSK